MPRSAVGVYRSEKLESCRKKRLHHASSYVGCYVAESNGGAVAGQRSRGGGRGRPPP